MNYVRSSLVLLLLMTLITGVGYPLLVTALGQWLFPAQANGSLLYRQNNVVGSSLIGQAFSRDGYFQSRPSATSDSAYNAMASGGSNLAASNPALDKAVGQNVAAWRQRRGDNAPVPVELVTASASGLDPHISVSAAVYQAVGVAKARSLPQDQVEQLIDRYTRTPWPAFIGTPVVNVVELNMALDQLKPLP
ncbi:potassium-transporting ATPase subunit KdpC [Dickeya dianthicola]|uniref:Potassium-transporting ATPase KdpC subunit n=7 Tax=Dickeya dianthicola TaxID=204039 RepID=A0ABX9NWJ9_9GAMM|nr:potassium-transporting ATPase subunit KdpC [Dickeya dianthicola]MCI4112957.1 potassium-transporting ATPase subunit KdpC [Dickeya dianthicola]MCI4117853.1 potassium-transporting ATPase subunit KdpC [Dickeya dianthicola]MCI4124330.1 potassium-transporting ATPase subunit KdpC [Dickeya dianthicola]MCI4189074.1 potassium-transporting ATPase subunit KdpC [Dickeya dianthicola]MCI4198457.1 potassium-transporting ATPase subunit KdpC [Dickeya dianthicola]